MFIRESNVSKSALPFFTSLLFKIKGCFVITEKCAKRKRCCSRLERNGY